MKTQSMEANRALRMCESCAEDGDTCMTLSASQLEFLKNDPVLMTRFFKQGLVLVLSVPFELAGTAP